MPPASARCAIERRARSPPARRPPGSRRACPRRRRPRACPPADPCCSRSADPSSWSAAPPGCRAPARIFPRTSSSGSGFFFCGIMLLPVLSASDSSKKRCSSPERMMRSSASRLRCTIVDRARVEERRGEIAIRRGIDAVGDDAREAEIAGQRVDVDRRSWCRRWRPSRAAAQSASARAGVEALEVAPERRGMREEEVRDQHRLRRPEMRERRHQRVAGRRGLRRKRRDDRARRPRCSTGIRRRRYSRRSSDTCSLRERPVCRRRPASPSRSTSSRSTKLCTSSSGPSTNAGFARPRSRMSVERGGDRRRPPSRVSTPAAGSARAHARLPATSSSKRRRSKPNDEPHSKAAASGAASKRPDQR